MDFDSNSMSCSHKISLKKHIRNPDWSVHRIQYLAFNCHAPMDCWIVLVAILVKVSKMRNGGRENGNGDERVQGREKTENNEWEMDDRKKVRREREGV